MEALPTNSVLQSDQYAFSLSSYMNNITRITDFFGLESSSRQI